MHLGRLGTYWANVAVEALQEWNDAGSHFRFSWSVSSSQAVECGRSDGIHTAVWSSTSCVGDWPQNVVGMAPYWLSASGRIVDADVLFNLNEEWSVYRGTRTGAATDFRRVAMHEFGHVLGLAHPDDHGQQRTAIMNSGATVDTLQSDDLNGIRELYGIDPGGGRPNLVVETPRASDLAVTPGQVFTLSATVRNAGGGTAAATRLRYYYWRSSTREWVVVSYDSVRSLAATASSLESVRLTAPSRAGTYYYNACVASVGGESNTGDNCSGNVRVRVGTAAGRPDLVVEQARVSDRVLLPGQAFTLFATIRNAGNGASAETWLRYYHRPPGGRSWVRVGGDYTLGLAATASSPESIRLTAPSDTGTHWYAACVRSVARESNTRNNCSANVRVTVGAGEGCTHDLGTVSGSVTRSGSWTGDCESVHFSGAGYVRYYNLTVRQRVSVTIDLTSPSVDTLLLVLYAGAGTGGDFIWLDDNLEGGTNARIRRVLLPGTYTLEAMALPAGDTGPFTLTLAARPSAYEVTIEDVQFDRVEEPEDGSLLYWVRVTAKNTGTHAFEPGGVFPSLLPVFYGENGFAYSDTAQGAFVQRAGETWGVGEVRTGSGFQYIPLHAASTTSFYRIGNGTADLMACDGCERRYTDLPAR